MPAISGYVTRPFSGREVAKVLTRHGFERVGGRGSHRKFLYVHPETGEKRVVTVPMHDELAVGTLQEIADQCGANDFHRFCDWLEASL